METKPDGGGSLTAQQTLPWDSIEPSVQSQEKANAGAENLPPPPALTEAVAAVPTPVNKPVLPAVNVVSEVLGTQVSMDVPPPLPLAPVSGTAPAVVTSPGMATIPAVMTGPAVSPVADALQITEQEKKPALAAVTVNATATASKVIATIDSSGGGWTIPLLCAGIAIIAACLLIPAADENHRLVWEREKLQRDLQQINRQIEVNDEFLQQIGKDPNLAERLAQRQMKQIREGTSVLELKDQEKQADTSPLLLVTLPPPEPMPPYKPVGGTLALLVRHQRGQLYLTGGGLLLMAVGLVLGGTNLPSDPNKKMKWKL